jgi:hypothetical protein
MLDPGLRRECEEAIRAGSKSFLAASMLLPGSTRWLPGRSMPSAAPPMI